MEHPEIGRLREQFRGDLSLVRTCRDVEQLSVKYLGKKGPVQGLMQLLKTISPQERPLFGQAINALKEELESLCQAALSAATQAEIAERLSHETIDITLPGRRRWQGIPHPIQHLMDDMIDVCRSMGFSVQYGPDVDSDWYNYEGLNFPPDHPARQMQDTFYIDTHKLLRSHTSNTQLRVMEKSSPPIRVIAPGTVYRNENISARSHVFFHQLEGLYVNRGVALTDLFATMQQFWKRLLHRDVKIRFRPSYFPFVEPGVEVDISCTQCEEGGVSRGCRLCKQTGWLEVAGAGMVHPEVLRNGGIDPEEYTGFAWGMGVERLAMLKYHVDDIRRFAENDLRFLSQMVGYASV